MQSAIHAYKYEDLDIVGIRICPPKVTEVRPFHIAFLLDTSGSMEGERLTTVQRTLHLFVDEMKSTDCATFISYNTSASLLCVGESDTAILRSTIDTLKAAGGTNMEAALCKLAEIPNLADVDAVFFLTDGEVNQGICSVEGISNIAINVAFRQYKIPVYTLGYGISHNAKLLQAIALGTRSSYTYAETSEMIPSVVGTILGALRDEVAKGVYVEWRGAECWEHGAECDRYCVGSVVADKPQWVVLKGSPEDIRVHWKGAEGITVEVSEAQNLEVLEQWFRVKSVKLFSGSFNTAELRSLESEIVASCVGTRPLMLRILGEIAEHIAFREHAPTMSSFAADQHLTRLVSNVTAFANQRGEDIFASPTQRLVSGAMVHQFSQDPGSGFTQDPGSGSGSTVEPIYTTIVNSTRCMDRCLRRQNACLGQNPNPK